MAQAVGFTALILETVVLRKEKGKPTPGYIVVLQRLDRQAMQ